MGDNYLTDPLVFLVQVLFGLYILVVMLRFLLQLVRADFYNPISQFLIKATRPVLTPLRRIIPGWGGVDWASLVVAWLLKTMELTLVILISNGQIQLLLATLWAIPQLLELVIYILLFSIFILALLSWISPAGYNPVAALLHSLASPLLTPVRRYMPAMGGLDLSPMVAMIALVLLKMLLIPPLEHLARTLAQ